MELPLKIRNPGLINALMVCWAPSTIHHPPSTLPAPLSPCSSLSLSPRASRTRATPPPTPPLSQYDLESSKTLNCDFDRLDLSTNPYLEKNLEYLCDWVDDLAAEQQKFQYYARNTARQKWKKKQENEERRQRGDDPLPDADDADKTNQPPRMESLLISNQIDQYCSQMHHFAGASFGKLFLAGSLHKEDS